MAKINYQQHLLDLLKNLEQNPPSQKPTLLLHACCAPCSSHCLELLARHFQITIYYYNPNIHPQTEYTRRLQELVNFLPRFPQAVENSVSLVETQYIPQEFFDALDLSNNPDFPTMPEKGQRCRVCYRLRMEKAQTYAHQNHFDYWTTTLSISPHKDSQMINLIGLELDSLSQTQNGPIFLQSDFKKNSGFLRSTQISQEYGLWRQDYCGCIYSKQNMEKSNFQGQSHTDASESPR